LRALTTRLQSVREEERKRLAREIHDQLGQALTAIKLDVSSLVQAPPGGPPHLSQRILPILNLVDGTIETVRRISAELRPGMLDDLGLVDTIEWAAEEFEARTGIKCRLDLPPQNLAIDPERATAIFRILQETLTNVARHADASEVEVRLGKRDKDLILVVQASAGLFASRGSWPSRVEKPQTLNCRSALQSSPFFQVRACCADLRHRPALALKFQHSPPVCCALRWQ
jgi:signal transduction histidine kinase